MFTVFRTCVLFAVIFLFTFVAALFACGEGNGVMSGGAMGGARAPAKPAQPLPAQAPTKIAPPTVTLKEQPADDSMTAHLHGLIGARGREIEQLKKDLAALQAKLAEPKDGRDGAPGKDGKDGSTPVIPAPVVNVPAPVVNVPPAQIKVDVPAQAPPVVNVTIDTTALAKAVADSRATQPVVPVTPDVKALVDAAVAEAMKKMPVAYDIVRKR